MQKLRIFCGKVLFWASWPFLYLYLRGSTRSRLIIECSGEVLLLRGWYDGGKWSLPGGGVHANESAQTSAVRETKEEVGIELKPEGLKDLGGDVYVQHGLRFKIQRFGCRLDNKPKTTKQHLEVIALEWFELAKITPDMVDASTWRHVTAWKQFR